MGKLRFKSRANLEKNVDFLDQLDYLRKSTLELEVTIYIFRTITTLAILSFSSLGLSVAGFAMNRGSFDEKINTGKNSYHVNKEKTNDTYIHNYL